MSIDPASLGATQPSSASFGASSTASSTASTGRSAFAEMLTGEAAETLQGIMDDGAFTPTLATKNPASLAERAARESKKSAKEEEEQLKKSVTPQALDGVKEANDYSGDQFHANPELKQSQLEALANFLSKATDPDALLDEVLKVVGDPSNAVDALDLLLEKAPADKKSLVSQAKILLQKRFPHDEITVAKNIALDSRLVSVPLGVSPAQCRNAYINLREKRSEPLEAFGDLLQTFPDQPEKIQKFCMQAAQWAGRETGQTLEPAAVATLCSTCSTLQVLGGVYGKCQDSARTLEVSIPHPQGATTREPQAAAHLMKALYTICNSKMLNASVITPAISQLIAIYPPRSSEPEARNDAQTTIISQVHTLIHDAPDSFFPSAGGVTGASRKGKILEIMKKMVEDTAAAGGNV